MIVIYSQDKTYICNATFEAEPILLELYGPKLGSEAIKTIDNAPIGTTYRMYGGPLVKVISKDDAIKIREKEKDVGML